jgi:aspartate/methionine/tyrosine aminotransferase
MELLEKARLMESQGYNIIHMEVGEPGFETPQPIIGAAVNALREGKTFYTHSLGIPELREAVSRYYYETQHVHVGPDRIIITNGSSGAFLLLFSVLLERGKKLLLADPGYPCYRNIALLADCSIEAIPVTFESNYEILPANLTSRSMPDLLVLANPSNPTGAIYREGNLSALYQRLSAHGGALVIDEIYSALTYDMNFVSAVSISDDVIVISGFSKAYAMTGWRLGWMIVPPDLVRPIQKLAQNVFIAPPSISQYAALEAFKDEDAPLRMCREYKERRDFLVPRLKDMGFSIPLVPSGAFYVYANIEQFGIDSMIFVERALEEAKVALTPGYDFGTFRASSHIRLSYADKREKLEEGCLRLETWLHQI